MAKIRRGIDFEIAGPTGIVKTIINKQQQNTARRASAGRARSDITVFSHRQHMLIQIRQRCTQTHKHSHGIQGRIKTQLGLML